MIFNCKGQMKLFEVAISSVTPWKLPHKAIYISGYNIGLVSVHACACAHFILRYLRFTVQPSYSQTELPCRVEENGEEERDEGGVPVARWKGLQALPL